MKKKILLKIKRAILLSITTIAGVFFCLGVLSMDSENLLLPILMMGGGFAWLLFFWYANTEWADRKAREIRDECKRYERYQR